MQEVWQKHFKINTFIYEDRETQTAKQETDLKPLIFQTYSQSNMLNYFYSLKHIQNKFLYKSFSNLLCMYMKHPNQFGNIHMNAFERFTQKFILE